MEIKTHLLQIEQKEKDIFTLSRKKRWITYYLLLSFYLIMTMDQGTLSGSINNLKKLYNMEDKELGLFGFNGIFRYNNRMFNINYYNK